MLKGSGTFPISFSIAVKSDLGDPKGGLAPTCCAVVRLLDPCDPGG